jgi:hypothetical protein
MFSSWSSELSFPYMPSMSTIHLGSKGNVTFTIVFAPKPSMQAWHRQSPKPFCWTNEGILDKNGDLQNSSCLWAVYSVLYVHLFHSSLTLFTLRELASLNSIYA